jgi:uncharacterized protein (TIGR00369 family)
MTPPLAPERRFELVKSFFEELIPFNKLLGVRLTAMGDGSARLELPYRPELIGDPVRHALHGGVISTLIDTAGGAAVWTQLGLEDRVSTIDLRVDYLAPGRPLQLVVEAKVVRTGNRVGVIDARAFHDEAPDVLVATGKGVYSIKRAPRAGTPPPPR